jgi:hypothetical protein
MPVRTCQIDGRPGFKWGDAGTCYPYTAGDEASREAARDRAIAQGIAIGDIDIDKTSTTDRENIMIDVSKMDRAALVGLHATIGARLATMDQPAPATPPAPVAKATADVAYDWTATFPVSKVVEEKRLVTGVVLEPDEVDAHGDFEKAETIERAAHKFLAEYNRFTELGVQHTMFGELGIQLVESYIAPVDLTFGEEVVKAGSWVITVKVINDTLWQAIKSGAITGFSIGGVATVAAPA